MFAESANPLRRIMYSCTVGYLFPRRGKKKIKASHTVKQKQIQKIILLKSAKSTRNKSNSLLKIKSSSLRFSVFVGCWCKQAFYLNQSLVNINI